MFAKFKFGGAAALAALLPLALVACTPDLKVDPSAQWEHKAEAEGESVAEEAEPPAEVSEAGLLADFLGDYEVANTYVLGDLETLIFIHKVMESDGVVRLEQQHPDARGTFASFTCEPSFGNRSLHLSCLMEVQNVLSLDLLIVKESDGTISMNGSEFWVDTSVENRIAKSSDFFGSKL